MAEIGGDKYTQSPCSLIRGGYCVWFSEISAVWWCGLYVLRPGVWGGYNTSIL